MAGQKRWALGTSTGREDRVGRTFMGSRDARDVYETLRKSYSEVQPFERALKLVEYKVGRSLIG